MALSFVVFIPSSSNWHPETDVSGVAAFLRAEATAPRLRHTFLRGSQYSLEDPKYERAPDLEFPMQKDTNIFVMQNQLGMMALPDAAARLDRLLAAWID